MYQIGQILARHTMDGIKQKYGATLVYKDRAEAGIRTTRPPENTKGPCDCQTLRLLLD